MNSGSITVLTICAATLVVGAMAALLFDLVFRDRLQINQRLDELSGKTQNGRTTAAGGS